MPTLVIRQVSIATKIRQVTGLAGTTSVDENTNAFLEFVGTSTRDGRHTDDLTPGQVKWIEQIFGEHFA